MNDSQNPIPESEAVSALIEALNALNERQRRFVLAYTGSTEGVPPGNATQAAIWAGYSKRGADVQAVRLLGNARIQSALKAVRVKDEAAGSMARHERKLFWSSVMRGEMQEGGVRPTVRNRLRASELLAKAEGDFSQRIEIADISSLADDQLDRIIAGDVP